MTKATAATRILFLWWGRRGAMSKFTLDLAKAAVANPAVAPLISVSRSTELLSSFADLGESLLPVETFTSGVGALTQLWRLPLLRRTLSLALNKHRADAVVVLMSHVWTPLIAPIVRASGVPYVVVVHDARQHPDDPTSRVHSWLMRDLIYADQVVTLSRAVGDQLVADGRVDPTKLHVLFHPDFSGVVRRKRTVGSTLRVLFFGRIMGYKGLPLFVDAIEHLRARGVAVEASVAGEGPLGPERLRLERLHATIRNRWISEAEISEIFAQHDVVVLSHLEASQSGVVAEAFGHGIPVVATPVGGLIEQIEHGRTGLLADRVDSVAIADSLQQLALAPDLMETLAAGIAATQQLRSMPRFLAELVSICERAR